MSIKCFDGHNDLLARLWLSSHADPVDLFLNGRLDGHLDLARCQSAGFAGGLFAIFVPPFDYVKTHAPHKLNSQAQSNFSAQDISAIVGAQLNFIEQIAQRSNQRVSICLSASDIHDCMQQDRLAVVVHLEGAEVIDSNFECFEQLYARGLRSVGPLWNMPNQFGHGLQASFPHSPDTGLGLTPLGQDFIRLCSDKRVLIDVSHMNEKAFWDTAKISQLPLIATHSNAHHLCPQARNLTDVQLEAIQASQGCVGINFDTAFLRTDGKRNRDTPVQLILQHIEYLMQHLGEDHVALGSDFDGSFLGDAMGDVTGLIPLQEHMQQRGYSRVLIEKLYKQNWLNALQRVWAN